MYIMTKPYFILKKKKDCNKITVFTKSNYYRSLFRVVLLVPIDINWEIISTDRY